MTAELSRSSALCDRSELVARVLDDPDRRVVVVSAIAGFGKSGFVAQLATGPFWFGAYEYRAAADTPVADLVRGLFDAAGRILPPGWTGLSAAELVAGLCATSGPALLVVEDAHQLSAEAADFLRQVAENLPSDWRLAVTSREELALPDAQRVTAADLAFTEAETAKVLGHIVGTEGIAAAGEVHRLTGGWPMMTVAAADWLRVHAEVDPAELADRARDLSSPADHRLLSAVASLPHLTPGLAVAIGFPELRDRLRTLAELGALWQRPSGLAVHQLVAVALDVRPPKSLHLAAAGYFLGEDDYKSAVECVAALDDPIETIAFLTAHPPKPVVNGPVADAIVAALATLPAALRTPEIERIEGRTRFAQGDWPGALRYMYRATERAGCLEPRMAWRIAAIHRFLGEHNKALEICRRVDLTGADLTDQAGVAAWMAFAHVVREEPEQASEAAYRALRLARESGDPGALAAAHSAVGMLNEADCDQHHEAAVEEARRWGDLAHVVMVQANHARSLIVRGLYAAGLDRLDDLVQFTARAGEVNGALTASLYHRGFAKLGLGQLDGAADDFRAALHGYQRSGSRATARPLLGIADVYRERGDVELAAAAYREAAQIAGDAGDRETHVLCLAGLARVRAAGDPDLASDLVTRALAESDGVVQVRLQIAAGWVALSRKESPESAIAAAGRTVGIGIDRGGLAEVLELRTAAATDPVERSGLLRQAAECWASAGHRVGAARVALALARVTGASQPQLAALTAVLRGYGVKESADAGGLLAFIPAPPAAAVYVRTLGGFQVFRDGLALPPETWQSRKARDLVKILIARRGVPVGRETVIDLLWPGEPVAKCANRLSVALSTVRGVFDPERRYQPGHFLAADKFSLTLRNVTVDVEAFLTAVRDAEVARQRGDPGAMRAYTLAEDLYTGDFLAEDRYEDWAAPVRDQANAKYLAVVRTLAAAALGAADYDQAQTYALRALERDDFDEEAHLVLIRALRAAGRHGQARQRYRTYVDRMHEIGVTPANLPPEMPN